MYQNHSIDNVIDALTFESSELASVRDALNLISIHQKTTIVDDIGYSLWKIYKDFLLKTGNNAYKERILDQIKAEYIFSDFIENERIREYLESAKQGKANLELINNRDSHIEIYKNLDKFSKYPQYQLVQLLNNKHLKEDLNLLKAVNDALLENFNLATFDLVKNGLVLEKEDNHIQIEIFNILKLYNEMKSRINLAENTDILMLIESFKIELIRTNIFGEFKKQKDIQTGLKFTDINKKESSSRWK